MVGIATSSYGVVYGQKNKDGISILNTPTNIKMPAVKISLLKQFLVTIERIKMKFLETYLQHQKIRLAE
jgi:hypothetical protein